jgi:hypothetical protein
VDGRPELFPHLLHSRLPLVPRPKATRILEKQNWLQMSQVLFRCPRINHQVVLLFKDSQSGTAEPGGPDSRMNSRSTHE